MTDSWPLVDPATAERIHELIDLFEATTLVAKTEGPAVALVKLSGARTWDDSRPIWTWFVAWCQKARELRKPFTAIRIAEFVYTYHVRFIPAAGIAGRHLDRATKEQRMAIEFAALDACFDLDPNLSVRPDLHDFTVRDFRKYLAEKLRPVRHLRQSLDLAVHEEDAWWYRAPIGQRTPSAGEYQVIWQAYMYGPDEQTVVKRAHAWLQPDPRGHCYCVVDSAENGVTVDGGIERKRDLLTRPCQSGEFEVYWDTHVFADDYVDAANKACQLISEAAEPIILSATR